MKFILDILKGMVMGVANVIPGVSGGTMAVAMGIYDRLINAFTHIFKEFKKSLMSVLPIGIGMGLGIVGLSMVIDWMFGTLPIQTNLLFIGLILGGIPAIWKRLAGKKVGAGCIIGFVIFFAVVVGLSFIQHDTELEKSANEAETVDVSDEAGSVLDDFEVSATSIAALFGVGVVASATMVIPGVSGSMMLMLLGYYTFIIGSVSGFVKALSGGDIALIIQYMWILIPFGLGVLVGIVVIAKLVELLLNKFETVTFWCILGLIAGSPFAIVIVNLEIFQKITAVSGITGVVALVIGTAIALFLGKEPEDAKVEEAQLEDSKSED